MAQTHVKRKLDALEDSPSTKRHRCEVNAGHKCQICRFKRDHPQLKYSAIQAWAEKTLNIKVGKSTVGDIVRASDKWLSVSQDVSTKMRTRNPKNEQLEDALFLWFTDIRSRRCAKTTQNNWGSDWMSLLISATPAVGWRGLNLDAASPVIDSTEKATDFFQTTGSG